MMMCVWQDLDVSFNRIDATSEIAALRALPLLRSLVVKGNPVARRPDLRREVMFFLGDALELDGVPWTPAEVASMQHCRTLGLFWGWLACAVFSL